MPIIYEQYKNLDSGVWVNDTIEKAAIRFCGNWAFQETRIRQS